MNVIIFGTGSAMKEINEKINLNNVTVVAYADNDENKIGKEINDIRIIAPTEINKYNYDYIVIASMFFEKIETQLKGLNVEKSKILKPLEYNCKTDLGIFDMNIFNERFKEFLKVKDSVETICTGISYMNDAIDVKHLSLKGFNFAMKSQDLFYDYKIIQYISDNHIESLKKLKYVLIGLSYYSFHYDMSKSVNAKVTLRYFDILKTLHNYFNDEFAPVIYKIMSKEIKNEHKIWEKLKDDLFVLENPKEKYRKEKSKINYECGKQLAILDADKNYKYTVTENICILKNYLKILKNNNIKPIIVVCPTTKYYYENFPLNMKQEFYEILKKVKQEFSFEIWDYFDSQLFNDEEFYHVSHLNSIGSTKFTKIINDRISLL